MGYFVASPINVSDFLLLKVVETLHNALHKVANSSSNIISFNSLDSQEKVALYDNSL